MKQENMKFETDCVKNDGYNHIYDDTSDETLEVSDTNNGSKSSFGRMTRYIISKTQKIRTTIVDSLQGEIDSNHSTEPQKEAKDMISKEELNRIRYELQRKGITTQLAAEQAMCEIIQRQHSPNEETGRNSMSSIVKMITYPKRQYRRTVSSSFVEGEYWRKLGSRLYKDTSSQKPIYRRKSDVIVDMLGKINSAQSNKARRHSSVKKRGSSEWMLEESAVRSPWDKL